MQLNTPMSFSSNAGESRTVPYTNDSELSATLPVTGRLLKGNIPFHLKYPRMRGVKSVPSGRINGGPDRRPSYPGDQWIKQTKSTTKIWVKVAMGIAYFLCVSLAAFFLAIYYVLFWSPNGSNSYNTSAQTPNSSSVG